MNIKVVKIEDMNYFPRILSTCSIKILSGFYKNNGLVNVKDLAFLFLLIHALLHILYYFIIRLS